MNIRAGSSVRPAEPGDAALVAALLAELGYPDNQTEEVRRRLAMWEHETAGRALVAERDGQVVGVISVTAIPYLEREGCWGRIVALVVSSAARESCPAGHPDRTASAPRCPRSAARSRSTGRS